MHNTVHCVLFLMNSKNFFYNKGTQVYYVMFPTLNCGNFNLFTSILFHIVCLFI